MVARFASLQSSLDPQKTKDGQPYGPYRYKEIVRECYFITKNSGVTREDIMSMTPVEREYFIEFIQDEAERTKEYIEKVKQEREQMTRGKM